jgi:imidazole glycerol-phosphate synthase subunit HisH
MSNLIGIVNYGVAGNTFSIQKALERAGGKVFIIEKPSDFQSADKIIIPGVGSFSDAIRELNTADFIRPLKSYKKPMLGICLGMQILASLGNEYGKTTGLNLVDAEVVALKVDAIKPHLGFEKIDVVKANKLLENCENQEFYFMHSYEMVNCHDVMSTSTYAKHIFVSSIRKGNIYGVQFHPEKSREAGIQLFKNFINI